MQFESPEFGIRAIVKIMRSYKALGLDTIKKVIGRWAPATENNTDAYISAVCAECSVGADDSIDLETVLPLLIRAIIWHENGLQPYTDDQINNGISLA